MTLHVLSAATRLNLRSVRAELMAAHEEDLISAEDLEQILAAHTELSNRIADAVERNRGIERAGHPGAGNGSPAASRDAPAVQPRSLDAATLVLVEDSATP